MAAYLVTAKGKKKSLVTEMKIVVSTFLIINKIARQIKGWLKSWLSNDKKERESKPLFRKKQVSAPQEGSVEAFFENRSAVFIHFSLWFEKLLNFLGGIFFISESFYQFWNITLLYNTSGTPTITVQYVFSDEVFSKLVVKEMKIVVGTLLYN